uniref:D-glutamate cyclase, mitochondrial-like n=1 Tax=Ciona intestinalis TaxID=7719 RepID=UPI0002B8ED83|nr:D-glutamate cyclase, mitochondrial-like [Ciona intestinalis]XP_018669212.1 D-glutamate cyclase, mitochondrial-like [Ciona intestinalis]XP_018669213.1 D-glutamate cyclase, mitochondrial-like [Ciona intestinalis]|eukprot:XP_018669211.1 D-glutamate cyclase, mitochondrial-like [Ciona intestinalis]
MVTFYIGCSFSFNKIMLENSLLTPSAKCVSMYKTNIECYPSGPFKCKTIVSMRAMHKDKLSQIHQITSPLKDVHGAPIHYGNPSAIGIPNLKDCFAGKTTDFDADEIPVFWACGMTAFEAISTAGLELAFTHGPGSVFLTDVLQENIKEAKDPKELCEVIEYSPGMYSALSKHAVDKLEALDKIVQCDLGKRGIDQLIVEGDFIKAALALSHANKVAIVTGAPVHQTHEQPDETDGLPGVISLAAALQSLDKTIDVLADSYSFTVIQKIISKCVKTGLLKSPVTVIQAQDLSMVYQKDVPKYDVVVAAYSIQDLSSEIKQLTKDITDATKFPNVVAITLVHKSEKKPTDNINKSNEIHAGLTIQTANLNLAFWSMSWSLYTLMSCPIHERYVRKAIGFPMDVAGMMKKWLPSIDTVKKTKSIMQECYTADTTGNTFNVLENLLVEMEQIADKK